jgi:hypothetical protein
MRLIIISLFAALSYICLAGHARNIPSKTLSPIDAASTSMLEIASNR